MSEGVRPARDLAPLFEPRGVVVAGASTHPGKFGFVALHSLLAAGYGGAVFATNPERPTVLGVDCVASLADVPAGAADLVMVCTPPAAVPDVLRQAAGQGIRGAFIATAGYREAGSEGAAAEAELVALAEALGMVVAGPNGQGLVSTPVKLCCQIAPPYPAAGTVAMASQSGNLLASVLNLSRQTGVGISRAVSAGNSAMLAVPDYLEWFATDPATNSVIVYVEDASDGRRLFEALRGAAAQKPVVVVKGGSSSEGARAAASHTGSLASDDRVFAGMVRQAGAVRCPAPDVGYELAATFATQPLPAGPRVAVLTTVGGWGVLSADAIATSSLRLAPLPADLHDAIAGLVPPRWSRNNPIDLAGGETRDTVPTVLDLVTAHPEIDAVLYLGIGIQGNSARSLRESPFLPDEGLERMATFHERQEARYAEAAVAARDTHAKPVLVASELAIADPANPAIARLRELGSLCHASPLRAIAALEALWQRARRR
jgi:acetyltransferase